MIQEHVNRRRIIVAGTTAVLGTAGIALGTQEADAEAEVGINDGLEIEASELAPDDGEVFAPWLIIEGPYSYRVEADPDVWEVFVLVGDGSGNTEAVGITDGSADARQDSGTYAVRAPITAASFWEPADFSVASDGSDRTVTVPVEVAFVVRDAAGEMLVQARAQDTAEVTVTQGGVQARIAGSAEVVMQDDADSPTPTPPEA